LWREICGTARADGYELDHFYSDVTITRMAINSTAQARSYGAVLRQLSDEKLESNLHARDWDASEPVCEVDSIPPAAMQTLVPPSDRRIDRRADVETYQPTREARNRQAQPHDAKRQREMRHP
jgi:hypothetical protein